MFYFEATLTSCASRSSPSGGPRDTTAPALDTSFPPNFSTRFSAKEINLVFNEYITLKNAQQQIRFTPPLNEKPDVQSRGKEVNIRWEDTLLENTTYTISFGTAIEDFTEGNTLENFKYVFSTGDYIDSLSLRGTVKNSQTGGAESGILVALYDLGNLKKPDSIPFLNLPTYYAYTGEAGDFQLSNLKYGRFHIVAFEDKRGDFKMSGIGKTAFFEDTLTLGLDNPPVELFTFEPNPDPRFFGMKQESRGMVSLPFNYPVPNLKIEPLNPNWGERFSYVLFSKEKDTARFWFDPENLDSVRLKLSVDSSFSDTVTTNLRNLKIQDFTLSLAQSEVKYNDPVSLKARRPVQKVNLEKVLFLSGKDTLAAELDSSALPLFLKFTLKKRPKEFKLILLKNAIEPYLGEGNDSAQFSLTTLKGEDLGNLDFTVKTGDTAQPLVLVMKNPAGEEIVRTSFTEKTTEKLRKMKPGVYTAQLILDDDGDGKWSTGNYLKGHQPEKILTYPDKMEIRANWDLELDWLPKISETPKIPTIPVETLNDSTGAAQDSLK